MVEIRFSRHAKRRARLYKIPESIIVEILAEKELAHGNHEIIEKVEGFKFPLKIVAIVADDIITIVTSYPLKKGRTE